MPDVLRWPRGQFGRKAIDQAEFLVDLAALGLDCLLGVVARLPHLRHVALHDDADRVVRVLMGVLEKAAVGFGVVPARLGYLRRERHRRERQHQSHDSANWQGLAPVG